MLQLGSIGDRGNTSLLFDSVIYLVIILVLPYLHSSLVLRPRHFDQLAVCTKMSGAIVEIVSDSLKNNT